MTDEGYVLNLKKATHFVSILFSLSLLGLTPSFCWAQCRLLGPNSQPLEGAPPFASQSACEQGKSGYEARVRRAGGTPRATRCDCAGGGSQSSSDGLSEMVGQMATDVIFKKGPTVDPNRLGEALGGIAVQGIQGIFSKPKPSGPSPAELERQRQAELERQRAEQQRQEELQRAEQERQRLLREAEAARRRELERKKQEALGEMKDVETGEQQAGTTEELTFKDDESASKEALGKAPARPKRICRRAYADKRYYCSDVSEKPADSEQGPQPEKELASQESPEAGKPVQSKASPQVSGPAEGGAVLKVPEQAAGGAEGEASGESTNFFGTGGPEKPILESPEETLKTDHPGALKGSLPIPPEAVRAPPTQPLKAAPASPSAQTGKIPQKLEPFNDQKVSFPQAEGQEAMKEQADAGWEKAADKSFKGLSKEAQSKQTKVICQKNITVSDFSCLNSTTPAIEAADDSLFKRSNWKTLENRLQKVGKNAKSHAQKAGVLLASLRSPTGAGSSGAPVSQGASAGAPPKIEEPAPGSEQQASVPEEAQTPEQISGQVKEESGVGAETKEKRYVCQNVGSSRICRWEEASQTQKRALPQSAPKRTQPAQRSKPSGVRRQ